MQINTDIYPEVGYDSYSRWTNDTVYYSASEPLEHSIFYSGTISENVQFCDENNYSYIAEAPECAFTVTAKEIVKGDIFFIKDGYRHFNFNGEWAYNNTYNYNIVTEFDISQFYFDLDKLTVHVYDLSQADGGHAIGNAITMPFSEYRNKTAEYKATHLIRQCSHNGVTSGADSFFKYKNVADYSAVNVVPMIRYVLNDKTTLYLPFCMLNDFANPDWQGPINLDRYTGFGKFGAAMADIYLAQYPYIGKWYNGWTAGSAAQRVTMANCGNVESFVIKAGSAGQQVAQVNNGYQIPDISSIDTDKYCVPVFVWGTQWDKRIAPFYSDEFIMRYFASSGLRFKVDNVMYIGYMDANGQCNGDYILESELADSDSANKNITDFTGSAYDADVPYVPPVPPVPPSGDNIDDMNMSTLWAMSSDAGFARYFLLSHNQLASLMTWLSDTTFPDGYDPYAYILSLLQFPLKLTPLWCMPRTPAGHIVIGGEDTNITASLIANEKAWVGAGTYDVPQLNGNFLDYDPYTQYELYIPCCGWVSLPDIVCGRKIAVKINYDLTTAAIIGNVYVTIDGKEMIVASKSGMMGRETIVTGEAQGVRSAQITSALLSAGTGALNVATGAISGNAVAAVSGGYNIVAGLAQANIAANSAYTRTIGSTGGRALLCQFDQCYLKICTTRADIPAIYGHTCGYVCNLKGKVSDFTGYTVFDNVDVSGIGKATDREKKLIKQILESGVIINPIE